MALLVLRFARRSQASQDLSGAIAQLGERLNGIQEVSGSIPLSSTKNTALTGIHRGARAVLRRHFEVDRRELPPPLPLGVTLSESGFPIFQFQLRDAAELARVVCNQSQFMLQGDSRDLQIVRADYSTGPFQLGADFSARPCALIIERQ